MIGNLGRLAELREKSDCPLSVREAALLVVAILEKDLDTELAIVDEIDLDANPGDYLRVQVLTLGRIAAELAVLASRTAAAPRGNVADAREFLGKLISTAEEHITHTEIDTDDD